ncbi:hypothetical protein Agabi119p4_9820 [Agaricus bisporus var. burnettii]|uniref:Uncharacterized protein n=1 Tax=Agaricus bisporus var. burnettii TaxID=192524 RepID=A0A8H7EX01_AGABI|nr:hypothetical protein Agabi119p4_9820 [Agaricus bisporus var. burnettii]
MTHPSPLLARVLLLDIVVSRTLLPPPQDSRCALSPDGSVTDPPPFSPLLPFLPLLQAHCPSIFLNWSVRPLHSMNIVISPLAPALPCCICWLDHLRHPFSLPMVHALQPQLVLSLPFLSVSLHPRASHRLQSLIMKRLVLFFSILVCTYYQVNFESHLRYKMKLCYMLSDSSLSSLSLLLGANITPILFLIVVVSPLLLVAGFMLSHTLPKTFALP